MITDQGQAHPQRPPIAHLFLAGARVAMPDLPRDRRTWAYHEAGHAVLAHILNLPIVEARVHAATLKTGEAGAVEIKWPTTDKPAPIPDAEIPAELRELASIEIATVFVAGVMAELALHNIEAYGWLDLDCSDWRGARRALKKGFDSDLPLWFCQKTASAVLAENWRHVIAVAAAIEESGTVTAAEIASLADI